MFAKAREKARQSNCSSNIKQFTLSALQYTQDYDERTVFFAQRNSGMREDFHWLLEAYIKNSQLWSCPSHTGKFDPNDADHYDQAGGYGIAYSDIAYYGRGVALAQVEFPAEMVWFGDCTDNWLDTDTHGGHLAERHNDMCNTSYLDGHVKTVKKLSLDNDRYWPDY